MAELNLELVDSVVRQASVGVGSLPIGTASPERRVVVFYLAQADQSGGGTIGGIEYTVHGSAQYLNYSSSYYITVCSAEVPTGDTASFIPADTGGNMYVIGVYSITGDTSTFLNASVTALNDTNAEVSETFDTVENSVAIFHVGRRFTSLPSGDTLTGLDVDFFNNISELYVGGASNAQFTDGEVGPFSNFTKFDDYEVVHDSSVVAPTQNTHKIAIVFNGSIPDATGWTMQTTPEGEWERVATDGSGTLVAVNTGVDTETAPYQFMVSTDEGVTWIGSNTPTPTDGYSDVAYGNGLFVAVGTGRIATSPDGITWTQRTSPAANTWRRIAYGNNTFVCIASGFSTGGVMTSPDGITWTQRTIPTNKSRADIAFGNGVFLVVGNNAAQTSPDGITWTLKTSPGNLNWVALAFGNGRWMTVATNTGSLNSAYSDDDGVTWTLSNTPSGNSSAYRGIFFSGFKFYATSFDEDTPVISRLVNGAWGTERPYEKNQYSDGVSTGKHLVVVSKGLNEFNHVTKKYEGVVSNTPGEFTLGEVDSSTLIKGSYLLSEDGFFDISGSTITQYKSRILGSETGTYTITGSDLVSFYNKAILAESDNISILGTNVSLLKGFTSLLSSGSVSITGNTNTLSVLFAAFAETGNYNISGQDLTLLRDYFTLGQSGEVTVTGLDLLLQRGFRVSSETGSFSITGTDTNLFEDIRLQAEQAFFNIIDSNVNFIYNIIFVTEAGPFTLTGTASSLKRILTLLSELGSYGVTGNSSSLHKDNVLSALTSSVIITGEDGSLLAYRYLTSDTANFSVTGQDVEFARDNITLGISGAFSITGSGATLTAIIGKDRLPYIENILPYDNTEKPYLEVTDYGVLDVS